jgi:hypothetical protein
MPFMYDKEIVVDLLQKMVEATQKITKRTKNIHSVDDFLVDDSNQMLLDRLFGEKEK